MSALRIFIADDEAPARERLKELLNDIAGELPTRIVGEARHGLEALELLPSSGAEVALLDIKMPGMSGLEVARRIHASSPGVPIVLMTEPGEGSEREANAIAARLAGVFATLTRPFDRRMLAELVVALVVASDVLA